MNEKERECESTRKREHRFQSKPKRIVELYSHSGDNRLSARQRWTRWSCMLMSDDPTTWPWAARWALPWAYLTTSRIALSL